MTQSTATSSPARGGPVSRTPAGTEPGGTAAYERDGAEIYRRSFAMIRAEADLSAVPGDLEHVVVRMIHACGMTDLPADLAWSPGVGKAGRAALAAGGTVLCDSAMVAAGITRKRLPAANPVVCTLADPRVPELAARLGTTRSAAAVEPVARVPGRRGGRGRERADGPVPPAGAGGRRRAMPGRGHRRAGGLHRRRRVQGRAGRQRGCRTWWCTAAAAARPSPRPRSTRSPRSQNDHDRAAPARLPGQGLTGVGVGPGDPDLLTVRATKVIAAADVIAYHCARHGNSIARAAAAPYLPAGVVEEILTYPVTTEGTSHPGGYAGALADFYAEATERLAAHLERGRDVVVLCEGDPAFYGSYQHLHTRLSGRFRASVVPGISSVSAAAAAVGVPLVQHDETLTVLPGTLADDELRARLARADAVAVLKLGRTFDRVRAALADTGLLHRARYVERAGTSAQRVEAAGRRRPGQRPVHVAGPGARPRPARRQRRRTAPAAAPHAAAARRGARRGLTSAGQIAPEAPAAACRRRRPGSR